MVKYLPMNMGGKNITSASINLKNLFHDCDTSSKVCKFLNLNISSLKDENYDQSSSEVPENYFKSLRKLEITFSMLFPLNLSNLKSHLQTVFQLCQFIFFVDFQSCKACEKSKICIFQRFAWPGFDKKWCNASSGTFCKMIERK